MNTYRVSRPAGLTSCGSDQEKTMRTPRAGRFTGLIIFALIGLLLAVCLLVLTAGSRVWNDLGARTNQNYTVRTVLSYVANKVHAADSVEVLDDNNGVLALGADYGGKKYNTYIYYQDGALLEYFGRAELSFRPELGQTVTECGGFAARREGSMIYVTVTDAEGQTFGMHLMAEDGLS